MSTLNYPSGNDWESSPYPYSRKDSGPNHSDSQGISTMVVWTHLSIPLCLAPSTLSVHSPPAAHQVPSSFPSLFHSNSSSGSSDSSEDYEDPPSAISPSHDSCDNPFDSEFYPVEPLEVSLPIDDPQWIGIFARSSRINDEGAEEFARKVKEDSNRVGYLKEINETREHNRLANLRNEPLTPIPNLSGLIMPLGYHDPITSVSQIYDMPLAELDGWLLHYGIQTAPQADTERMKQLTLARHVGVVAPHYDVSGDVLKESVSVGVF